MLLYLKDREKAEELLTAASVLAGAAVEKEMEILKIVDKVIDKS